MPHDGAGGGHQLRQRAAGSLNCLRVGWSRAGEVSESMLWWAARIRSSAAGIKPAPHAGFDRAAGKRRRRHPGGRSPSGKIPPGFASRLRCIGCPSSTGYRCCGAAHYWESPGMAIPGPGSEQIRALRTQAHSTRAPRCRASIPVSRRECPAPKENWISSYPHLQVGSFHLWQYLATLLTIFPGSGKFNVFAGRSTVRNLSPDH
jgi:hypothetical protein